MFTLIKTKEEPNGPLQIGDHVRIQRINPRHPMWRNPTTYIGKQGTITRVRSSTHIDDFTYVLIVPGYGSEAFFHDELLKID